MKRPFFWLMAALLLVLALGVWLLVMGVTASPFAVPIATSM